MLDAENGAPVELHLPETSWAFGLSPDGRELWAVAEDARSFVAYALDD